jgi:predicted SAM-dependent methyltransferase/GT2 family glycosyltransferase
MKECLYILLPVHNRCEITKLFIDCLVAQTYRNFHLVLIDDGSTDGTEQMVREKIDNLTVIKGEGNWWWAGSLQQGYDWLKKREINDSDPVLIINDDVIIEKDFLAKGRALTSADKQSILLAQFRFSADSQPIETGINADLKHLSFANASSPEEINCLSTRGIFLKWADFLIIGGFHPRLLPHYWSDYEFTIRANRKGYKCLTSPELSLLPMPQECGRQELDYSSFLSLLTSLFSTKSIPNPIHKSFFILLACPVKWWPRNFFRIFFETKKIILSYPRQKLKKTLAIFRIKKEIRNFEGEYKVVIGAGGTKYPGWISTDYPALDITDPDSMSKYFDRDSIKAILSEHLFEHLTLQQAESALEICREYLAPGGYLRIAVPDGFHPSKEYIDNVKPGGLGTGSDGHKILYNHTTITELIRKAGLKVELLEWYDCDGEFNLVDWQPETGMVRGSSRYDPRNSDSKFNYTSLIVDAINLNP